ncbi:MAG TPA: prepilin-type N-terminal cleavage/methylation domain-containing protein [Myxococcota bacterium]|nr:prepilin-type N-terminal cleavage/methylation domain-containing protein [Myxococcota bacterium]
MTGRRCAGFTLLEVIAVVLLTGILITFTTDFYLDLSRQSRAAVERARNTRRAVVLLDRVARDLESAMLVRKPGPVDPLEHPWLFLAEADDPDLGAQRLKFSSRGRRPRSPQAAESDVEMVAWQLARTDGDDFELLRWSSPRLPAGRDLSFPAIEESDPVARGIASFGVFLTGEAGEPVSRWDSSTMLDSSELPLSAEIQVSFFVDEQGDAIDGPYTRLVTFPLRPIDLEAQLEAAGAGPAGGVDSDGDGIPDAEEDEDGDGIPDGQDDDVAGADGEDGDMTVAECVAMNQALFDAALQQFGPEAQAVYDSFAGRPMSEVSDLLPQLGLPIPANCQ